MNEANLREILDALNVQIVSRTEKRWLIKRLVAFVLLFYVGTMEFRIIPQNRSFEISEDGSVVRRRLAGWGTSIGKVLSLRYNDGVYVRVKLSKRVYQVHRLVCSAFNGPAPADKPIARHLDDMPRNNHWTNLEWGTNQDNSDDAVRNGRTHRGEDHFKAKLTWALVEEIRSLKGTESERKLAVRFGVSRPTINAVLTRRTWT